MEAAFRNWDYSSLERNQRLSLNILRMRIHHREAFDWEAADQNEETVAQSKPVCSICNYDLRNSAFTISIIKMCGHLIHTECIEREFTLKEVKKCPICQRSPDPRFKALKRVFLSYSDQ